MQAPLRRGAWATLWSVAAGFLVALAVGGEVASAQAAGFAAGLAGLSWGYYLARYRLVGVRAVSVSVSADAVSVERRGGAEERRAWKDLTDVWKDVQDARWTLDGEATPLVIRWYGFAEEQWRALSDAMRQHRPGGTAF